MLDDDMHVTVNIGGGTLQAIERLSEKKLDPLQQLLGQVCLDLDSFKDLCGRSLEA